jgi:outer membrane protein with beta-barrel domain
MVCILLSPRPPRYSGAERGNSPASSAFPFTTRGNMSTLRATGFCALLAMLLATTATAQQAQTRHGFWFGGGLGYGSMGLSCTGCSDVGREGSVSGFAALGGTLRQNILLGVEMNGWTKSQGAGTVTMGNLSGAAYWYPMPTQGLFVKAGAGYSNLRADDGVSSASDGGLGILAGVGYDIRAGRKLSITPVANWYRGSFNGGSADVLQFGLGVFAH